MHLVLDIDLDFFVTPIVYSTDRSEARPDPRHHSVMPTTDALDFVTRSFRLIQDTRVHGKVFEEHVDAFDFLMSLDCWPLHIVHVDAHGDLGFGLSDDSPGFICEDLLPRPLSERRIVPRDGREGLGSGNWLAYLLAQRRVSCLDLVYPDHWKRSPEVPGIFWRSGRAETGDIEMPALPKDGWSYLSSRGRHHWSAVFEPPIRYRRYVASEFQLDRVPDTLLLTRSPKYSPESADALFERLSDYVTEKA